MKNAWPYIAYAFAWIATGIAVAVGIYFTKDANCLWAMLIPAMISFSTKSS
jgi:hypothetical protein